MRSLKAAFVVLCLAGPHAVVAQNAAPQPGERGWHSVIAFGAVADGSTDDTAAFKQALDAAAAEGGGIVFVPAGRYLIAGHLDIPTAVTLQGVLSAPPSTPCGSVLLTTAGKGEEDGEPFITLRSSSTVKGLSILYPEQSKEKPVPYPWCIRGAGDNCSVVDMMLTNPWQAVDFGTIPCGRHYIHGLNAQPIRRGIYVDRCFDIGRIENVHLWPFWTVADKLGPWLPISKEQGEGFIFGRSDWEYVSNSFAIAYAIGIHFVRSKDATIGAGNYLLTQSGADISKIALQVDETQSHSGVSFVNSQLFGDVVVKPTNEGMVRFTGCGFFGSLDGKQGVAQARLAGRGRVSFDNCSFHCIDPLNKGTRLIVADNGRLSIVGCQFVTSEFTSVDPIPIYLGPNVVSAIIVANEFNGRMQIENHSSGQVRIADNTSETEAAYNAVVGKRGQVPMDTIVPGTEVVTLVPNGDFERCDAHGVPIGWTRGGDIEAGRSAVALPAGWTGKTVVICRPGVHKLIAATMTCKVKLKPKTDYIVSGYLWNLPHGDQTVMANIDVGLQTPGEMRLAMGPRLPRGDRGYFIYGRFSTATTGTDATVRIFYDGSTKLTNPKVVSAQWDRIAVTEASKFKPPKKRK